MSDDDLEPPFSTATDCKRFGDKPLKILAGSTIGLLVGAILYSEIGTSFHDEEALGTQTLFKALKHSRRLQQWTLSAGPLDEDPGPNYAGSCWYWLESCPANPDRPLRVWRKDYFGHNEDNFSPTSQTNEDVCKRVRRSNFANWCGVAETAEESVHMEWIAPTDASGEPLLEASSPPTRDTSRPHVEPRGSCWFWLDLCPRRDKATTRVWRRDGWDRDNSPEHRPDTGDDYHACMERQSNFARWCDVSESNVSMHWTGTGTHHWSGSSPFRFRKFEYDDVREERRRSTLSSHSYSYDDGDDEPGINYPLREADAALLVDSNAVSPVLPDERLVHRDVLDSVVEPTHPDELSARRAARFWAEFEEVVDVRLKFLRDPSASASSELDLPEVMQGYSLATGAEQVRADFPNYWPSVLIQHFLSQGARMDGTIVPQRSAADFVSTTVLLSRMAGWAVSIVSPTAFACKWRYGRARPEEVAWNVSQGGGLSGAPASVVAKVRRMQLSSAEGFTAYSEGSPRHPSFPAMHSAASSSSLWLPIVMDLSAEQLQEARRLDWAVSRFRTVAGVHYDSDNRAGLMLGQQVVAKELPAFLFELFGSQIDRRRLEEKIVRHRFDWWGYQGKAEWAPPPPPPSP